MDLSQVDARTVVEAIGAAVTVASVLANYVAPWTWVGKALHFIAFNGPAMQAAVKAARGLK